MCLSEFGHIRPELFTAFPPIHVINIVIAYKCCKKKFLDKIVTHFSGQKLDVELYIWNLSNEINCYFHRRQVAEVSAYFCTMNNSRITCAYIMYLCLCSFTVGLPF